MKRAAVFLATLLYLTLVIPSVAGEASTQHSHDDTYVCPMHPEVTSPVPGSCPRCGMALVTKSPRKREYRVDAEALPGAVVGRPIQLRFTVRDPETQELVRHLAVVHERRYHLFVISEHLEYFEHVHPEPAEDGSWVVDVTLPHAGQYHLYSDFLPEGATPQVIPGRLVTEGYADGPVSQLAGIVPDATLTRTVDDMSVTLDLSEAPVAQRVARFVYQLRDAETGAAVTDLEPYLGAWGHSVIMSADREHFLHAHPTEPPSRGRLGPGERSVVTFEARLPEPGTYRVWTQFKRRGQVSTAVFTIAVVRSTAGRMPAPTSAASPRGW